MDEAARRADDFEGMNELPARRFESEAPASESEAEEERFRSLGYEVDADAVAAAIVARLLAGRLPDVWRSA